MQALRKVRDVQTRRVDCLALGEFSRNVAEIAPEMVLDVAERIPDARERNEARTAAAVSLYEKEPERALAIIRSLQRPVDRSSALLRLADRLLGLSERPHPQPLLEELP